MKGIKPTRISALYLANAREFLRDRMAMFLVMLLPVAFAVFFGLIFGGEDGFTLQLGVVNEDNGPAGAQFLASLVTSGTEGKGPSASSVSRPTASSSWIRTFARSILIN